MINRIEGGNRWGSTAPLPAQHNTEASSPGGQLAASPAMRSGSRSIDFGAASPDISRVPSDLRTMAPTRALPTMQIADSSLIAEPKPIVDLQAIDSSEHSNARALEKWSPLLSDLPENEREKAAKALNRPLAAAKMLQDGGTNAEKALVYLRDNPAIYTAMDTAKDGGRADGHISNRDTKSFIKNMEQRASDASHAVKNYREKNPTADAQSLRLVQSSALLLANEPLLNAADAKKSYTHSPPQKNDRTSTLADLNAIVTDNPTLAPQLKVAARIWSHPGLFGILEHADVKGEKLARVPHDGKLMMKDMKSWIREQAPANSQDATDTLHNAAALGLAAKTDISKLNEAVFTQPQQYSGAQKSAALIKLQQTLEQVIAGREYRNTEETEKVLNQRIETLQKDGDVIQHFEQAVPREINTILLSDPSLAQAEMNQRFSTTSPAAPRTVGLDASPSAVPHAGSGVKNDAQAVKDAGRSVMNFAKSSLHAEDLTKAAGSKTAIGLAGKAGAAIAGKVVGAIAGEAAGAAAASAVGAAAGPVGWAVSGALSIGMGIAELVNFFNAKSKLKHRREDFAKTVNPVLEQFNIPKPR
ncbi:type III effector HrpK [Pectobacterium brasiliense]|uniref:type III effector HrpK domain-containing protein n=1 Tax=Pectobacterium brasiliense TaxID=180957 RepID=UPI001CE0C8B8|nr:type III effector HrpK domain-containing protein [Pectobacterium brasiliense]MCA5921838.1 type III effector HrpK [Pectobacterium brasiliense]MCA5929281.1 type III effector HrpK [Pectobacterium brasiliense]MCA5937782.1 type III effector HrpK [Pectobacterium brasiliense]MCA5941966.1 type III effector HrpK [Pectobacterium brasiliense]MCA5946078.1 type III effector HrpK [Pectobacterium brasiliense]